MRIINFLFVSAPLLTYYVSDAKEIKSCEKGWKQFGKSCYAMFETALNWEGAQNDCKKKDGLLAEVQSEKENRFIMKLRQKGNAWLGGIIQERFFGWCWGNPGGEGIELREGGSWRTVTGQDFPPQCLSLSFSDGNWKSESCNNTKSYVCEKCMLQKKCSDTTCYQTTCPTRDASDYDDAEEKCKKLGGTLVQILDKTKFKSVTKLLKAIDIPKSDIHHRSAVRIAGNVTDGKVDSGEDLYKKGFTKEKRPSDQQMYGEGECIVADKDVGFKWRNILCLNHFGSLCEINQPE